MMEKKLRGNFWKYALLLIANKRVFAAIIGVYFLSVPGVTPKYLGILLLISSIFSFVFEIPSGYISDKIGHKQALVISRIGMVISTVLYLFATNIHYLILASLFSSLGAAFLSGTGSAFMHETFRALKREEDYTKVMGKISAVGFSVPLIFSTLVPFLVSVSFRAPFLVGLAMDIAGLYAAFAMTVPPVTQEHVKEIGNTNFIQVLKEGLRLNFFKYALFSSVVSGILFANGGFRDPYQKFLGVPVILFGIFFGSGRVLASILLAYSGKIQNKIRDITVFYKWNIIIFGLLFLILGTTKNVSLVLGAFIVLNGLQWGLSRVDDSYLLEIIKPSKFKATLLSVSAQFEAAVIAVVAFFMGYVVDKFSYKTGYQFLGIIFVVTLTPLYFYIKKSRKSQKTGANL